MRQGGVLSPIPFTIYLDDQLVLIATGIVGAVCYANDIVLLYLLFGSCLRHVPLMLFSDFSMLVKRNSLNSRAQVLFLWIANFCFFSQRLFQPIYSSSWSHP